MIRKLLAVLFSLTVLLGVSSLAQTADALVQENLKARGGLSQIKTLTSLKMTGKMFWPEGPPIPFTLRQKRPHRFRMDAEFQGRSLILAYDGETGWKDDPFAGIASLKKMVKDELIEAQEQADLDGALVDYQQKGHAVELVGKEDWQGASVYKLKLTLKPGNIRYVYLDSQSFLEVKTTSTRVTPLGDKELLDTYMSDYRTVGGLVLAHCLEKKIGFQSIVKLVIEKVEVDGEIDESIFRMPVDGAPKTPPAGAAAPAAEFDSRRWFARRYGLLAHPFCPAAEAKALFYQ